MITHAKHSAFVLHMMILIAFFSQSAWAQFIEQEFANYSNLPDSTLRVESCVYLEQHWYSSLRTSYYMFNPQVHAQLVKLDAELQVVATLDQPDRQWNYLFTSGDSALHGFGVEYLSPLKSVIIGAEMNSELNNIDAIHLSDSLESAVLYDVVKHPGGYTLLFGHIIPVNQLPFHKLGLMEVNNDLEVIRQQEFDQFPELYQWTPAPNHYRLSMTSTSDYAIIGNSVTWLANEDWSVIGESETEFLSNDIGSYKGYYLGAALPVGDGQQIYISTSGFGDETDPWDFATLNDVYIYKANIGTSKEEIYSFGRVDTNDAPPLKGFIAVDDGYLVAAQSLKYWYIWQDEDNTGVDWPTSTILTKLNAEMEPEWELYLKDDHQTNVNGIAQDPEAGILLYGQRRYLDSDEYYAHLVLLPNNPVGIEAIKDEDILVYPNPTTHAVRLQIPAIFNPTVDVFIYNLAGKCIAEHLSFDSQQQLPMNYPPGMYMLEVRDTDKAVRTKVVVE